MARRSDSHRPPAVEVLNATGASDIVLVCEHASNHIPASYDRLGLARRHLDRHVAWDIGAAKLTRRLAERLDATAFLAGYSRLLIDLNRPLDSAGSIPTRSEDTDIPGNIGIDEGERARRAATMFTPFHAAVGSHLDERQRQGRPTRLVTIHSFTPVFQGVPRRWHAGILYDRARALGDAIVAALGADAALRVAANVPYVISLDGDYAIPVHGDQRGIEAVLVEVRQDLLSHDGGIADWSERLGTVLAALPGARSS